MIIELHNKPNYSIKPNTYNYHIHPNKLLVFNELFHYCIQNDEENHIQRVSSLSSSAPGAEARRRRGGRGARGAGEGGDRGYI